MSNLLILLTKKFPFSQGQESFLAPELPYLTKEFDKVILISCESGKKDIYMDNTVIDADVIRLKDYNSKMKYVIYGLSGMMNIFNRDLQV
ncbi:MAG: hypothetical protein WCI62_01430, partial [Erysipelotrichaceae bacterium]